MSYNPDNIFAKIIEGELPAEKVYEDDRIVAIRDINPAAPVHVLVIPKGDYLSFDDFALKSTAEEMNHFFRTIRRIADEQELMASGYRLIMNHGSDASQTVPHFHVHILGGRPLGGLLPGDSLSR